jgi:GTPase Era involved in 16S rRNA processing
MNKKFWIYMSFAILIACNVVFILLFLRAPHRHMMRPKQVIINRLNLSNEQVVAYESLIDQHRKETMALKEEIMAQEKMLFSSLANNDESAQQSALAQIGELNSSAANVSLIHFQNIRNLCNPSQRVLFDELAPQLSEIFSNRSK